MDRPLLISAVMDFAADYHGDREIVTRTIEGPIHRYTYRDARVRAKQLAKALLRLGVKEGDRIGTLAWNTYRHFEIYYGVSGVGAVCHTINPRLFPEQISYIANHAEDSVIFLDLTFVEMAEALAGGLKSVKGYVILTDEAHMPDTSLPNAMCYETLVDAEDDDYAWPEFDETTASSLCYTSGTTGNPKGVLFTHRSTVLHTMMVCMSDTLGLSSVDVVMPVVPMFHANSWGLVYGAPAAGSKLVLPGRQLDGESVYELMETEKVTFTAGVPTVWLGLAQYLRDSKNTLTYLDRLVSGGSAMPRALIQEYEEAHDTRVVHAWGMTEMSPIGTTGYFKPGMAELPAEERYDIQAKQGRGIFGVEMKIVDDDGNELPRDGEAFGDLMVRGGTICSSYFKGEGSESFIGGWFRTGDVATLDPEGFMQIVDRSKDVIKSGGEWISSIDLENIAVGHPEVVEACVIAVPHPKWDERPLLLIVKTEDSALDRDAVMAFLNGKVVKWWLPDDIVFVAELPHTATGKLLKSQLRNEYRDYALPTIGAAG